MEDKEKQTTEESEFDFEMFIGEEGLNVLSTEQLKEINKNLPKWNIVPPSKYRK